MRSPKAASAKADARELPGNTRKALAVGTKKWVAEKC